MDDRRSKTMSSDLIEQGRTLEPLASEKVIVEAPASFVGSYKRLRQKGDEWSLAVDEQWQKVGVAVGVTLLVFTAWTLVLTWYAFFGLLVVPYRLIRRGQRSRERAELQHREQLAAIQSAS
jgi:hypothetical protein